LRGRRRLLAACLLAIVTLAVLVFFAPALFLPYVSAFLIKAGPPHQADMIVVLAGDPSGNRIMKAGELVRNGFAPKALVSGPDNQYGSTEDQLAIAFAERKGYPRSYFIGFPNHGRSTEQEAEVIVPELRKLQVHSIALVTGYIHTRRAGKAYRKRLGDINLYVVAAPESEFTPDRWWEEREGRKAIFIEWAKTIATWLRL
jgi:uncharacterized SAM-binding protein YcdF (DUF218 family)